MTMAKATEITDSQFTGEVLGSSQTVLVDFWATWCGPCRLIAPLMDWAADEYSDRLTVVKMEVDPNPTTVKEYDVQGIPTLLLIRDGEVIARTEGVVGKAQLQAMLDTHL
jgi:thioredoxin 1